MSMIPFLASLVMAGSGCVAFAAIAVTVQAQLPALRRLLADSRALAADREFLVQITAPVAPAASLVAVRQPRRPVVRVVRPAPALVSVPSAFGRPLRAAA